MKAVKLPHDQRVYVNVMESLVTQEVGKQIKETPPRIRRYLRMEEVVTYALNRLPTLYASSARGWQYQRQIAKRDLHQQISDAVRQAIMAVQVDPLRLAQPLQVSRDQEAEAVLTTLRALFQLPDLSWEAALSQLKAVETQALFADLVQPQAANQPWQPGQHTPDVAWTHRRRRPQHLKDEPLQEAQAQKSSESDNGWDNVLYQL
ncbi:MAG: late competence development ComFB family protein [Cyanobacteria bacterium P01_E01_bin.43]